VRRALLGVALLCTLTGCSAGQPRAHPVPSPAKLPAQAAGGSCQLLDYGDVATDLGLTFDVAAASQVGQTFSCVLEREGAPLPDLTFAVTLVDALDVATFKTKVLPAGSAVIGDLGKIGYSRTAPASAGAGPAVEVGWLAGNGRLIVLTCRLAAAASAEDAAALVPRLITQARRIDFTSI
jgi:hypothetical protein